MLSLESTIIWNSTYWLRWLRCLFISSCLLYASERPEFEPMPNGSFILLPAEPCLSMPSLPSDKTPELRFDITFTALLLLLDIDLDIDFDIEPLALPPRLALLFRLCMLLFLRRGLPWEASPLFSGLSLVSSMILIDLGDR